MRKEEKRKEGKRRGEKRRGGKGKEGEKERLTEKSSLISLRHSVRHGRKKQWNLRKIHGWHPETSGMLGFVKGK